ncbi:MAG: hypothetical protein HC866_04465 [Leptolyngbyaceae cyanobacterium RU_5_1]|nr:hypothetical protein [Leptolyngbyaceae cyanobacterium RU_5_1]
MTYQQKLSPWVIHKLMPNLKQLIVIRFRRRNDAEAYLKMLKQMQPHSKFAIAFDSGTAEYASQAE